MRGSKSSRARSHAAVGVVEHGNSAILVTVAPAATVFVMTMRQQYGEPE